jgi:hypothetical protein
MNPAFSEYIVNTKVKDLPAAFTTEAGAVNKDIK